MNLAATQVMTDWQNAVESADKASRKTGMRISPQLATHNGYPIGQITHLGKEPGSWNPEKGVK